MSIRLLSLYLVLCASVMLAHCSPPTDNANNTSKDGGTSTSPGCTLGSCPSGQTCDPSKGCVPTCQSDKQCAQNKQICSLTVQRCVDCNSKADCASGESCRRYRCFKDVPCQSSKKCPADQVCDKNQSRCVECLAEADCSDGLTCVQGVCDLKPPSCTSSKECKAYGLVCDTSNRRCVDCLSNDDCSAEQICKDNSCTKGSNTQSCTPGSKRCSTDKKSVETCDSQGASWSSQDCPTAQTCEQGICKPASVCTPKAKRCNGNEAEECKTDGSGWEAKQKCGNQATCESGVCVNKRCKDGEKLCAGDILKVCRSGSYTDQPCPSGETCSNGSCVKKQVCTPGTKQCDGAQSIRTCRTDGSGWDSAPCPSGQSCVSGTCQSSQQFCKPGSKACFDANTAQTCNPQGSAWVKQPCTSNESCQGGVCKAQGGSCQNGQTRSCYTGPTGTKGVGLCKAGIQTCSQQTWGACTGEQTPKTDSCGNRLDDNCDGNVDEGCTSGFGLAGGSSGGDFGYAVRVDSKGNSYVYGAIQGSARFGGVSLYSIGDYDMFLVKINSQGRVLWGRTMGSQYRDFPGGMDIDAAGNVYVTGSFQSKAVFGTTTLSSRGNQDVFVARYDTNGSFMWAIRGGGFFEDAGVAVAIDRTLDIVYVTGTFQGQVSLGLKSFASKGSRDIFLMKITARGGVQWTVTAGGKGDDPVGDVAVDSYGNAYVTGLFAQTAGFGSTTITASGALDVYTAQVSPQGTFTRVTRGVGGGGIAIDSVGNAYITGTYGGSLTMGSFSTTSKGKSDVFVVKLDTKGKVAWLQSSEGSETTAARIAVDRYGQAFVNGTFSKTMKFGSTQRTAIGNKDVFAVKFDASGKPVWATSGGGVGDDRGTSISLDNLGNVYMTGSFTVTARFGTFSSQSNGSTDAFLWQIPRP